MTSSKIAERPRGTTEVNNEIVGTVQESLVAGFTENKSINIDTALILVQLVIPNPALRGTVAAVWAKRHMTWSGIYSGHGERNSNNCGSEPFHSSYRACA